MTTRMTIKLSDPPAPPKAGWASGYDDAAVKRIARRYDKDGVPEGFFAALDARQSKLFRDSCPKRHGKKRGAA